MSTPQVPEYAQPFPAAPSARPRNGLGVAALVLGVASLVAALSFLLFPLGLIGGVVAAVLGVIAMARGRAKGATNPGQAAAGIICGVIALVIGIVFAVRWRTTQASSRLSTTASPRPVIAPRSPTALPASPETSGDRPVAA